MVVDNHYTRKMTEDLVKDFVSNRLQRQGFNNWSNQRINETPTPAMRTMRILGEEFEQAYREAFEDMMNDLDMNGQTSRETFISVAEVLFDMGIQWGRIVGLFAFAGNCALKAMRSNRTHLVDDIVQWTIDYLTSPRFSTWINQHNGWNGFVEFFKRPDRNHNDTFSWSKACTVGIATIASAAALLNFVQKS